MATYEHVYALSITYILRRVGTYSTLIMASPEQAVDEQQSSSLEEVGLDSQHEQEGELEVEPQGATAAPPGPTIPQPPYEEDFNPFTEEGIPLP